MRVLLVMAALACLGCPKPPEEPETPASTECDLCNVRFILEDKIDLVTLEHITIVLDGKVIFRSVRWQRNADVGPVHIASGTHLARVLLMYRKGEDAYDVRSEHEFTATEGLVVKMTALQGGSSIAPMSERVGIAWHEGR